MGRAQQSQREVAISRFQDVFGGRRGRRLRDRMASTQPSPEVLQQIKILLADVKALRLRACSQ